MSKYTNEEFINQFREAVAERQLERQSKQQGKRSFEAAKINRLTSSWEINNIAPFQELQQSLRTLRGRSRELCNNSDYAKKFLNLLNTNCLGHAGIVYQSKCIDPNGKQDRYANQLLENAFADWSRRNNCTVSKNLTFRDVLRLSLISVARDGECLIRKVKGYKGNRYKYSLQLIEADHLDEYYTQDRMLENGNRIIMGIEYDDFFAPVAYHILQKYPTDYTYYLSGNNYLRIPADEIIHLFVPYRINQGRGIPWFHTAMLRLQMLNGYEEASLIGARIGASSMGFFKQTDTSNSLALDGTDDQGNIIDSVEPGSFQVLPKGFDFETFNPSNPNAEFAPFVEAMLRGVASGLDLSYTSISGDYTKSNFSSSRMALMSERETYKTLQSWLIDELCVPIFEDWLDMVLLSGAVNLPFAKYDKFNAAKWTPRSWTSVDPLNDVQSDILYMQNGLKTASEICAERGRDYEEILMQLQHEAELRKEYGISIVPLTNVSAVQHEVGTPNQDTSNQGNPNK